MINHARTLLLNRVRSAYGIAFPGEEFVDPAFAQRALPPYLTTAHALLFGNNPDQLYLNYRGRQYMQLIHDTELEEYVLALDPRTTYRRVGDRQLFDEAFGATATQRVGTGGAITLMSTHKANEGAGIGRLAFTLTVVDTSTVFVQEFAIPLADATLSYSVSAGLTDVLTLSTGNLTCRLRDPQIGDVWDIESLARPARDVSVLLEGMEQRLGPYLSDLFPANSAEPIKTFENIWHTHPLSAYRYSALLLAIIYALETLPAEQATL